LINKRYDFITDDDYLVAKSNGIVRTTLESRVRDLGWDVDRAIAQPVQKDRIILIPDSIYTLAKENGIKRATLHDRIRQLKWDMEEAATRPIRHSLTPEKMAYIEGAKSLGVSRTLFRSRIRAGWSWEKAANTPKMERGKYDRSQMKN